MERVHNDRVAAVFPGGHRSGATDGFMEKGWMVFEGAWPSRQPATTIEEAASSWKAVDRALAEIAAAQRGTATGAGKESVRVERAIAAVRDNLLEAAQAAADASRRARALAERLDAALAGIADSSDARVAFGPAIADGPAHDPAQLSQREREVLAHVAAGCSNKAIAEALFVSPNTVKTHVASLLRKLDVNSRAQLATIAVQHGLG
jgi:DNA-binding NarL/FixJ family response regulator